MIWDNTDTLFFNNKANVNVTLKTKKSVLLQLKCAFGAHKSLTVSTI